MHGSNITYRNNCQYRRFSEQRVVGSEKSVDDTMHVQIRQLMYKKSTSQHEAIVLVTGDGNDNDGRDTFPKVS